MRNLITIWVALLVSSVTAVGQFYNDGAIVTIQAGALVHIQGDFINQGGIVDNTGRIELGGNWENTVMSNPLTPGNGVVALLGTNQVIGGEFNTLFNELSFDASPIVTLQSTIGILSGVDLVDGTLILNGNILHILSDSNEALQTDTGGIIAEMSELNSYVRWDIGENGSGQYSIPFENLLGTNIPVNFNLAGQQGVGEEGYLLFTTYGTNDDNTPLPTDVTNIEISGDDSGLSVVDRFWQILPIDYTDAPSINTNFTFDEGNEIVNNNDIDTDKLEIINWDSSSLSWLTSATETDSDNTSATTELIDNYGLIALWSNMTTSTEDQDTNVETRLWPNPTTSELRLEFDSDVTENAKLQIYNELGELVYEDEQIINTGTNLFSLDITPLNTGTYQLNLSSKKITSSSRFVKI